MAADNADDQRVNRWVGKGDRESDASLAPDLSAPADVGSDDQRRRLAYLVLTGRSVINMVP